MKRILYSATFSLALALLSVPALAQNDPPVLNQLPTAPPPSAAPAAAPAPVLAAPPAPATGDPLVLGQTYIVVTQQGNSFTGRLVNMGLSVLEFDTQELGHVSLERSKISQMSQLNGAKVGLRNNSYYDIGNGNRLFFAPTGRGLRKGEGSVQDVDVYLLGVNYGISNYFSIGGYLSILPGVSITNQLLVLTPKFSFPINGNDKLNFGTGLLYVRVPTGNDNGIGAGIVYGALTYGSADNNLTVGLGYGFVEGDIGSTPIIQLGGQTRVSRRISLITENYIVADSKAGVGGLRPENQLAAHQPGAGRGVLLCFRLRRSSRVLRPLHRPVLPLYPAPGGLWVLHLCSAGLCRFYLSFR